MADINECKTRRAELESSVFASKELKRQYHQCSNESLEELSVDLATLPENIHAYTAYYKDAYIKSRQALVAYRAREIFAEKYNGSAFIPRPNELQKFEMSVVEEERLLEQVQSRLADKTRIAIEKIDTECSGYEEAMSMAKKNDDLIGELDDLEKEIEELTKSLEEKIQREQEVVTKQTRELQALHNDVLRETSISNDMDRERARLEDQINQIKNDEHKRKLSVADSQEQQKLLEKWLKSIAPVVAAKVENNTLILTLGDGVGSMSNERILVGFNTLGEVTNVKTSNGRSLPPKFNHSTLMNLLRE